MKTKQNKAKQNKGRELICKQKRKKDDLADENWVIIRERIRKKKTKNNKQKEKKLCFAFWFPVVLFLVRCREYINAEQGRFHLGQTIKARQNGTSLAIRSTSQPVARSLSSQSRKPIEKHVSFRKTHFFSLIYFWREKKEENLKIVFVFSLFLDSTLFCIATSSIREGGAFNVFMCIGAQLKMMFYDDDEMEGTAERLTASALTGNWHGKYRPTTCYLMYFCISFEFLRRRPFSSFSSTNSIWKSCLRSLLFHLLIFFSPSPSSYVCLCVWLVRALISSLVITTSHHSTAATQQKRKRLFLHFSI